MKIEVKVTASEVRELVAAHLAAKFGIHISAEDLSNESYSGEVTLGKYGGFEYPPKPKKTPEVIPAPIENAAEATEEAKQPF